MDPWNVMVIAVAVAVGLRVGQLFTSALGHLIVFAIVCTFFDDGDDEPPHRGVRSQKSDLRV